MFTVGPSVDIPLPPSPVCTVLFSGIFVLWLSFQIARGRGKGEGRRGEMGKGELFHLKVCKYHSLVLIPRGVNSLISLPHVSIQPLIVFTVSDHYMGVDDNLR